MMTSSVQAAPNQDWQGKVKFQWGRKVLATLSEFRSPSTKIGHSFYHHQLDTFKFHFGLPRTHICSRGPLVLLIRENLTH